MPGIVLDAAQPDARLDVASSWTLVVRSLLSEPSVTADATVNLGGPFVRKAMSANQAAKTAKKANAPAKCRSGCMLKPLKRRKRSR